MAAGHVSENDPHLAHQFNVLLTTPVLALVVGWSKH